MLRQDHGFKIKRIQHIRSSPLFLFLIERRQRIELRLSRNIPVVFANQQSTNVPATCSSQGL
jgi:hypothetical protein